MVDRWGWCLGAPSALGRTPWFEAHGASWRLVYRYMAAVSSQGGFDRDTALLAVVCGGEDGVPPPAFALSLNRSALSGTAKPDPADGAAEAEAQAAADNNQRGPLEKRQHRQTVHLIPPSWVDEARLDVSPRALAAISRRSNTAIAAYRRETEVPRPHGVSAASSKREVRAWTELVIAGSNFDDGIDRASAEVNGLFAASWPWKPLPTPPSAARDAAAAVRDPLTGGLVLMGGLVRAAAGDATHSTPTGSVEVYSPVSGTWTHWTEMETPRSCCAAVADSKGNLFALGGGESMYSGARVFASCERYDRAADVWRGVAPMREARCAFGGALTEDGGSIVVCGGFAGNGRYLASAECFDVGTGRWSAIPSLSTARAGCQAHRGPDGRIWAVGGGGDGRTCTETVEAYDPRTGKWDRNIPSLSQPRHYMGSAWGPDGKLYVVGGFQPLEQLRSCERFDLRAGKWEL